MGTEYIFWYCSMKVFRCGLRPYFMFIEGWSLQLNGRIVSQWSIKYRMIMTHHTVVVLHFDIPVPRLED